MPSCCYSTLGIDNYITNILISASAGTGFEYLVSDDDANLSGDGCEVIPVGKAAPRGAALRVQVVDPSTAFDDMTRLHSVRATWTTSAAQP